MTAAPVTKSLLETLRENFRLIENSFIKGEEYNPSHLARAKELLDGGVSCPEGIARVYVLALATKEEFLKDFLSTKVEGADDLSRKKFLEENGGFKALYLLALNRKMLPENCRIINAHFPEKYRGAQLIQSVSENLAKRSIYAELAPEESLKLFATSQVKLLKERPDLNPGIDKNLIAMGKLIAQEIQSGVSSAIERRAYVSVANPLSSPPSRPAAAASPLPFGGGSASATAADVAGTANPLLAALRKSTATTLDTTTTKTPSLK